MLKVYSNQAESAAPRPEDALKLWRHLFGGSSASGLLCVWTGIRDEQGKIPQKSIRESMINYPKAAASGAEWALGKSEEGREVYFCAHLLARAKRIKENAADVGALWGDLDGAPVP